MRLVIQRVSQASVSIQNQTTATISHGMLILIGIHATDAQPDIDYCIKKTLNLRIFNDPTQTPNLNIAQTQGSILVVSQFTLYAATSKGNRPSYTHAAAPQHAQQLYQTFVAQLKQNYTGTIHTGQFGANMHVTLTNSGPFTIIIDSHSKQ